MLSRTDIRRECHKVTFLKGDDLNQRGAVQNLHWTKELEDGFEVVSMEASVSGSHGNLYDVKLKIDEDYREVLESDCECPAFYSYSGLCKHCVAVLLDYIEERKEQRMRPRALSAVPAAPRPRTSTYGFDGILNQYVYRDKVNLMQPDILGRVRLEPYFYLPAENMRVEFKIGCTRMYVLKNIGDFVNAVARNEQVFYGKELEFYHHPEAFTPESRPLVRFLQYSLLKGSSYMGNYLSTVYKRDLNVTPELIDDFLDVAGAGPLMGETADGIAREWSFREGEPVRRLEISGDSYGISVKLQRMQLVTGKRYGYFFDEGTIWKTNRERIEEIREFLIYMDSFGKSGLYVAGTELPAFARDMLPVLQEHFEVEMRNFSPEEYLPEEASFEIYLDAPQRDLLTCELYAVYGEEKYNLFDSLDLTERRDARREMLMKGLVGEFFNAYDPGKRQMVLSSDEERLFFFLQEGIPRLQELCEVYISDAVRAMRVLPAPHVSVGVSIAGDLLELTLQSEEMPMDQLISILSRYDRKKKYYRLKNGSFVDLGDEGIRTLAQLKQELMIADSAMEDGVVSLPRYRAMYLDGSLKEDSGLSLQKGKSFRALVRNMKTVDDNDFEVPPELDGILRGYQKQGFLWIKTLKANGFGGILADDMGLGKTLQVIAFLLSEWKESGGNPGRPWLIVCPASLVFNWKSEVERFAPVLPVYAAAGGAGERKQLLEQAAREKKGVIITSYELLRRDIDIYTGMDFACEVIDEAQFIKNHSTQAARAVKQVPAGFRLALTGTPVENRLSELWSIFDFLMPGFLYSYRKFRERYELPIVKNQDPEALTALRRMTGPFVLRRLKKDVLRELPGKEERIVYSAASGRQQKLYTASALKLKEALAGGAWSGNGKLEVLSQLMRLRQICCDPALCFEDYTGESAKLETCVSLIASASAAGHKILLFSQFASMLERIRERLLQEGISSHLLVGATPKEERSRMVQAFASDEVPVFLISLKAGGTGLNLTAADIVIHYDPWWNVAAQNQATDRAYRIGQEKPVTVYKLILKDTIEENLLKLQNAKLALAAQVVSEGMVSLGDLSQNELMELFEQNP